MNHDKALGHAGPNSDVSLLMMSSDVVVVVVVESSSAVSSSPAASCAILVSVSFRSFTQALGIRIPVYRYIYTHRAF